MQLSQRRQIYSLSVEFSTHAVLGKVHLMMFTHEGTGRSLTRTHSSALIVRFCHSVALAAASGRIELPVQSSSYPSEIIGTMLALLSTDPDQRPSLDEVIDRLSTLSRLTINTV